MNEPAPRICCPKTQHQDASLSGIFTADDALGSSAGHHGFLHWYFKMHILVTRIFNRKILRGPLGLNILKPQNYPPNITGWIPIHVILEGSTTPKCVNYPLLVENDTRFPLFPTANLLGDCGSDYPPIKLEPWTFANREFIYFFPSIFNKGDWTWLIEQSGW